MRFLSALLLVVFCCAPALAQDTTPPALAIDAVSESAAPAASQSFIVLKDGQMLTGAIVVMPSASKARYATYNGERIELSEISLLTTPEGAFGVARSPQLGTSMLVRQTMSGRVSIFEEGQGSFSSGLQFFMKDDGAMMMVNRRNLRDALSDNPESMRHLRRSDTYQKIGYAGLIAGAALVATGAAFELTGYRPSGTFGNPVIIAGSGVLLATGVNFVVPVFQQRATQQALHAYNR